MAAFRRVLFLSVSVLVLSPPSHADETRERIVVTGRAPVAPDAATSALTVIDRATIDARGDLQAVDLLRLAPGAAVNRSGPLGGLAQVRFRGSEANHALLLIDGVEASNPFTGEPDWANLAALDVARVEALRGEQSALWGSDAIGGVVNIAADDAPGWRARAEAGTYGTSALSLAGATERERFSIHGSAGRLASDGFDAAGLDGEDDGYDSLSLAGGGALGLTDALSLEVALRGSRSHSQFDADADFDGVLDDVDRELTTQFALGRVALVHGWSLGGAALAQTLAVDVADYAVETDKDGVLASRSDGDRRTLAWTGTAEGGAAETLWWSAALHAEEERERYRNRGASPGAPENQTRELTNRALAGELHLRWRARYFAEASVRHADNQEFDDALTWRIGAGVAFPALGGRVRASFGEGVKNPVFFDLYGFFPDSWVGNPDLRPERSRGYDIGWEQTFGDTTITASYFRSELEDEIFNDFSVFPATARNLDAASTREGVEVSLDAPLSESLRLVGQATFLKAEEDGGATEVRRPGASGSALVIWAPPTERFSGSLGLDYVGETDDFDFATFPATRRTLDAYTLVRAKIAAQVTDGVEVYARAENAFDAAYTEVLGYATAGRAVYVGASVRR